METSDVSGQVGGIMKKNILPSWFAKNLYCENSAGFSKAALETHKYNEVYDISERLHLFVE